MRTMKDIKVMWGLVVVGGVLMVAGTVANGLTWRTSGTWLLGAGAGMALAGLIMVMWMDRQLTGDDEPPPRVGDDDNHGGPHVSA